MRIRLSCCAEKAQNIIEIFENSIEICRNSIEIFENISDILSFFGPSADFRTQSGAVLTAAWPRTEGAVPIRKSQIISPTEDVFQKLCLNLQKESPSQ
jgi:hypothetical protein